MIWNIISSNLIHHLLIDQWGQLSELNTISWDDTTHFHSEDNYHTGCCNVSHCQQQSYSGLQSPAQLYSIYSWSTLGAGGWVGMYVSSNFKYGLFVFRGVSRVLVSISPIFTLFVTISSSFMSLFQSQVTCRNFTLTGPHLYNNNSWVWTNSLFYKQSRWRYVTL